MKRGPAAIPFLEAAPGPETCLFVGGIGEDLCLQTVLDQALVEQLGRLAVAGTGLDAVEATQVGDGLPGRIPRVGLPDLFKGSAVGSRRDGFLWFVHSFIQLLGG